MMMMMKKHFGGKIDDENCERKLGKPLTWDREVGGEVRKWWKTENYPEMEAKSFNNIQEKQAIFLK